jgi:WD40 repeat protein
VTIYTSGKSISTPVDLLAAFKQTISELKHAYLAISVENYVHVFDYFSAKLVSTIAYGSGECSIVFIGDTKLLIVDYAARIYDLKHDTFLPAEIRTECPKRIMYFGLNLVMLVQQYQIAILDVETFKDERVISAAGIIDVVKIDSNRFATCNDYGDVAVWNVHTLQCLNMRHHKPPALSLHYYGNSLLALNSSEEILIWNIETNTLDIEEILDQNMNTENYKLDTKHITTSLEYTTYREQGCRLIPWNRYKYLNKQELAQNTRGKIVASNDRLVCTKLENCYDLYDTITKKYVQRFETPIRKRFFDQF